VSQLGLVEIVLLGERLELGGGDAAALLDLLEEGGEVENNVQRSSLLLLRGLACLGRRARHDAECRLTF
jgi:hypothetical protein